MYLACTSLKRYCVLESKRWPSRTLTNPTCQYVFSPSCVLLVWAASSVCIEHWHCLLLCTVKMPCQLTRKPSSRDPLAFFLSTVCACRHPSMSTPIPQSSMFARTFTCTILPEQKLVMRESRWRVKLPTILAQGFQKKNILHNMSIYECALPDDKRGQDLMKSKN
jgi:hypothetical protein